MRARHTAQVAATRAHTTLLHLHWPSQAPAPYLTPLKGTSGVMTSATMLLPGIVAVIVPFLRARTHRYTHTYVATLAAFYGGRKARGQVRAAGETIQPVGIACLFAGICSSVACHVRCHSV